MDATSLFQLFQHFNDKIDKIWTLIPLARLCKQADSQANARNDLLKIVSFDDSGNRQVSTGIPVPDWMALTEMVLEIKQLTVEMQKELRRQNEQLILQKQRCLSKCDILVQHCQYLESNIPKFLQNIEKQQPPGDGEKPRQDQPAKAKKEVKIASQNQSQARAAVKVTMKPAKKKTAQESLYSNPPKVEFITTHEFESIPKYMRGRLAYEEINNAITSLNQTIEIKYKLMVKELCKYTDEEMNKYQLYKSQENAETTGLFFCTEDDYRNESKLRVDVIRKVLICLRHCKRVKEIRGPAKLLRYAVLQ